MKKRLLSGVLVLLCSITINAQVVVPNTYTSTAGNATFLGPMSNAARTYQMLINANQLTTLVGKELTGITFRLTNAASTAWPASDITFSNYEIYLGESVAPANRSLTAFSANEVGTPTLVRTGPLEVRAGEYGIGGPPKPFGPVINFSTPWLYTGGHLMVKIVHTGFTGTSTSVDAASSSAPGSGTDYIACWQGTGSVTNGNFCVAALSSQVPMPVKLVNFIARHQENNVSLNWTTATEINSDHFIIERSIDGKEFINVGRMNASGNSSTNKTYLFTDKDVTTISPILFYRLRMVDRDGKAELSRIVKLIMKGSQETLSIYPNPVGTLVTISLNVMNDAPLAYSIITPDGKIIRTGLFTVEKGVNSFDLDVKDLPAGIYFVKVVGELLNLQQRLIKN
jgi:hypothetical protein